MPDDRSQQEKLEAMAHQSASPNEAKVAEHLLFKKFGGHGHAKKSEGIDWDRIAPERPQDKPGWRAQRSSWTSTEEEYRASKPPPGWGITFSGDKVGAHAHARERKKEGAETRVVWRRITDLANKPYYEWRVFTRRKAVG